MKNELAYFTDSVNKLIEGKLILVDKNIASVLKCVATVPALCKCLSESLQQVSYVTEFSRARVTWTRPDGTIDAKLKLPVEHNRLFAFVVCLLAEVDSGRRSFLEFLKEYYHETDTNIGYERFANEVLKPFKAAGEVILHSVDPESLNMEMVNRAERYFDAEKIYIATDITNTLVKHAEKIFNLAKTSPDEFQGRSAEALVACESFINALYLKNPKILAISWLALKLTLELNPSLTETLVAMSRLMSQIAL